MAQPLLSSSFIWVLITVICSLHILSRHTSFYCTALYWALHINCIFYKLKVWGNPALSKSISSIFLAAFANFIAVCHILMILSNFKLFLLLFYLYSYLWSVIFDATIVIILRHQESGPYSSKLNRQILRMFWLLLHLSPSPWGSMFPKTQYWN